MVVAVTLDGKAEGKGTAAELIIVAATTGDRSRVAAGEELKVAASKILGLGFNDVEGTGLIPCSK